MIDLSQFSKNERADEYDVRFQVSGTIRMTIQAASLEDAQAKAEAMMVEEGFGSEIDDVDDISLDRVRKSPPMYRVMREGVSMQVSHPQDGDVPREPDERSF